MNKSRQCAAVIVCVLGSLLLHGCGAGGSKGSEPIKVPTDPGEQWSMTAPAEVGMNAELLNKAVSELPAPDQHRLSSMIVMRRGKPVLEHYWNGYDKDTMHDMRSATKSITSLMVGIAIDKGMLGSADDPIKTHLESAYRASSAIAHNIAIKDLLTMSSGLACNDRDPKSAGNEEYMYPKADWVGFFMDLAPVTRPGSKTLYCTAGVVTLGRIVAEASKTSIPDFSTRNLFAPMGITNARWASFDNGRQTDTGGHLYMRPRDMAKIGQLVLQGGKWNGMQIVSPGWITKATSTLTYMDGTEEYGYLWWKHTFTVDRKTYVAHLARGNGGQYIIVVPALELVAAFTGENYNSPASRRPLDMLEQYVLAAVR